MEFNSGFKGLNFASVLETDAGTTTEPISSLNLLNNNSPGATNVRSFIFCTQYEVLHKQLIRHTSSFGI
jgi:hypothetical protein